MDRWSYCSILANVLLVAVTADIGHIRTVDAQQDERVRLECTVTSKLDAEEVCVEYRFSRSTTFIPTGGKSIS